ncbi:DNA-binding NarL/FixJ family response regulator [Nocardioides daedukensis]|uniref:DNA-binding NarL/FixJ family response regulator n=1 Tax=Nocardioides daedukensis TaxID=634462 RepID=A0A7Y9UPX0_9ACTN|nr:response regulator transcription factor [Nocardioides daedukensis]NYG58692.1 DNA-binding NarL/FixJ family response regulator [Nocardioides daedukensis]
MTAQPIRVFLLDDHEIVRRGLRGLLESEGDIVIVGEARAAKGAAEAILELAPDVAVLDARLGDGSGVEVCRDVRSANPDIKALILTSHDDDEAMYAAIMAGAAGYVLKQIEGSSLISGIRLVASGHSLIDSATALRLLQRPADRDVPDELSALTPKEQQILSAIADGLTNRQIGLKLHLAEKTVKNHVTNVLAKLGVQRRTQAVLVASRLRRR